MRGEFIIYQQDGDDLNMHGSVGVLRPSREEDTFVDHESCDQPGEPLTVCFDMCAVCLHVSMTRGGFLIPPCCIRSPW